MWTTLKKIFSNKQYQTIKSCQICLNPLTPQNSLRLCTCDHTFCNQCTLQYIQTKIQSFELIKCQEQNCTAQIDENSQILKNLPQTTKLKYDKIKRFYFVSKNPDFKLCPQQQCSGLLNINKTPCKCNQCGSKYCPKCLMKTHWGRCQKQSQVYLENNLKYIQCTHCNFIIQKNQGCDHITCKCGYQLCYKCGGIWKGPQHMCVRSKSFQKVRAWLLDTFGQSTTFAQNSILKKVIDTIGLVLVSIFYWNLIIAVILSVVEVAYTIFSWLSPLTWVLGFFSNSQAVPSVEVVNELAQEVSTSVEEESSALSYMCIYLTVVFIFWLLVRKFVPKYKLGIFVGITLALTGLVYCLSKFLLIFYYEWMVLCFIYDNIYMVLCGGLTLLGIGLAVKIFADQRKRMNQRHRHE